MTMNIETQSKKGRSQKNVVVISPGNIVNHSVTLDIFMLHFQLKHHVRPNEFLLLHVVECAPANI